MTGKPQGETPKIPILKDNTEIIRKAQLRFYNKIERVRGDLGISYWQLGLKLGIYSSTFKRLRDGKTVHSNFIFLLDQWVKDNTKGESQK